MTQSHARPRLHIVTDFGAVIGRPQPATTYDDLARLTGMSTDDLRTAYDRERPAYDLGLDDTSYWQAVTGRHLDPALVDELTRTDLTSYLTLHPDTLAVLRAAHASGDRITLLSNAPTTQATLMREIPELHGLFDREIYSAHHHLAKPDPAIYTLATTGLPPGPTVFIDDRPENLEPAHHLGWHTIHYTNPDDLRHQLGTLRRA